MDVILTAGGFLTRDDPLAPGTEIMPKALLDMAGKPMIQWVLDAMAESPQVERVVVAGLPEDTPLRFPRPLLFLPDQGSMLDNLQAAARLLLPLHHPDDFVLAVSSDIPAITAQHVNWVIAQVEQGEEEGFYGVIERETMEARFPGARRTYLKLKGLEVCGGDLNALRLKLLTGEHPLWQKIVDARKSPQKQAALLGMDTLLLILLRRLTLDEAARKLGKKLGITVRAVVCPFAEVGMDVDKPEQLALVRADLSRRQRPGSE